MKRAKGITSFRLSDKARVLLKAIAKEDAVNMTAVLEYLIRDAAKERNINYEDVKDED